MTEKHQLTDYERAVEIGHDKIYEQMALYKLGMITIREASENLGVSITKIAALFMTVSNTNPVTEMSLEVHHVVRWTDAQELRVVHENGITLCVACHKDRHARR